MRSHLFGLALLLCIAVSIATTLRAARTESEKNFRAYMAKHEKVYASTQEYSVRYDNYKAAVVRIANKNKKSNVTYALNKFSDLSPAEFRATYLMKNFVETDKEEREVISPKPNVALPDKYDWRSSKVVSAVKDQAQCGSCWAFSVTENIESVYMLAKNITFGDMPNLSPQQIVDCDTADGGCDGGDPSTAYEYVKSNGLEKDSDYPYTAQNGNCNYKKADVYTTISDWKWATTSGDEKTLQQNLVGVSPLSICVDASNWQDYSSGVMGEWDCCWLCQLDHCVQLIGYDSTAASPYWIVRNSWGTDWGINGYIYVDMGHNTCGLTQEASTAVVHA